MMSRQHDIPEMPADLMEFLESVGSVLSEAIGAVQYVQRMMKSHDADTVQEYEKMAALQVIDLSRESGYLQMSDIPAVPYSSILLTAAYYIAWAMKAKESGLQTVEEYAQSQGVVGVPESTDESTVSVMIHETGEGKHLDLKDGIFPFQEMFSSKKGQRH